MTEKKVLEGGECMGSCHGNHSKQPAQDSLIASATPFVAEAIMSEKQTVWFAYGKEKVFQRGGISAGGGEMLKSL